MDPSFSAGTIFGIGNPLLDISAEVPLAFLQKYVFGLLVESKRHASRFV